jgi:hypothetical protein
MRRKFTRQCGGCSLSADRLVRVSRTLYDGRRAGVR